MPSFAQRLVAWQRAHGRHDLPWQGADAYRVWLSEIMLQQTQVITVIPYYARGRNLHKAAQIIVERFNAEFPRKFEDVVELPGIGRSTAAAVCALAYHENCAILDGNVKRVLAR